MGGRVRNESRVLQVQLCTAALLHGDTVQYRTMQYNALQYIVMQCGAIQCDAVQLLRCCREIGDQRDGGQEGEKEMGSGER